VLLELGISFIAQVCHLECRAHPTALDAPVVAFHWGSGPHWHLMLYTLEI